LDKLRNLEVEHLPVEHNQSGVKSLATLCKEALLLSVSSIRSSLDYRQLYLEAVKKLHIADSIFQLEKLLIIQRRLDSKRKDWLSSGDRVILTCMSTNIDDIDMNVFSSMKCARFIYDLIADHSKKLGIRCSLFNVPYPEPYGGNESLGWPNIYFLCRINSASKPGIDEVFWHTEIAFAGFNIFLRKGIVNIVLEHVYRYVK